MNISWVDCALSIVSAIVSIKMVSIPRARIKGTCLTFNDLNFKKRNINPPIIVTSANSKNPKPMETTQ